MPFGLIHGSRSRILAGICLSLMAIFIARLFYLQIIKHDEYVALANQEQLKRLVIPAKRGEIFALDGHAPVKLVLNETVYTVFVDPQEVKEPQKIASVIERVAGGNARANLDKLIAKKDTRYQIVATKVTRKQAEMMRKEGLKGLGFQETTQRVYPEAQLAAQILGFVNQEGKGQYGIEGELNTRLKGEDGLLQSVTDVSNVPLTIGDRNINRPAKNGDNVVLTIDRNIQAYTEQALATGLKNARATNGSAIVIDPQTGKVLAMANQPTYNPAEYNKVTDPNAFNNGVVTAPYEPGSVIKTFTVATGIDKGVIAPDSTFTNTDYITIDDRTISNATKGQTGVVTIQHALNWSLNTGMVTVAQRLGDGETITRGARDVLYSYFHDKFRLGQYTGIEVAGEQEGEVVPPTESEGNAVRYSNMSFGQGMNVTMVQVAAGFSAIINGGTYYYPTVIEGTVSSEGALTPATPKVPSQNVISAQTSATTKQMVHDARAAFHGSRDKGGYYIGGKTGTSQTLVNGVYTDDQTVATYLGFGGNDTPRYVIMVQVSGAKLNLQGNIHAMPIFTDISNWLLDYMKVQPKG